MPCEKGTNTAARNPGVNWCEASKTAENATTSAPARSPSPSPFAFPFCPALGLPRVEEHLGPTARHATFGALPADVEAFGGLVQSR